MPLTRRHLIASGLLLPFASHLTASAIDVRLETSDLLRLIEATPDAPGVVGRSFNTIRGSNNRLVRDAGLEPDLYWDPFGQDVRTLTALNTTEFQCTLHQADTPRLEFWTHAATTHGHTETLEALQALGWVQAEDGDYPFLAFVGDNDARIAVADQLNMLDGEMLEGAFDHIAMPDDATLVLGADQDIVRAASGWLYNRVIMDSVKHHFHNLDTILPVTTLDMALYAPEALPVADTTSTLTCTWLTADDTVLHAVGVRLDAPDENAAYIARVEELLATASSSTAGVPYREFLTLENVKEQYASLRFDFSVSNPTWNIVQAAGRNDLGFMPILPVADVWEDYVSA